MRKLSKAMIFAAGLGTRLRPLTDNVPKALAEVGGKPLLGHLMEKLRDNGFEDVVVNVHYFADMIEDYVRANGGFGMRFSFSDERDLLRDTGGGLLHARDLLEGSGQFLVHNVDVLSNLDFSRLADFSCLASLIVSERETSRYLLFDEAMNLVGWENRKTGEIRSPYMTSPILTGQGNEDRQSSAGRKSEGWQSSADQKDRARQNSENCAELLCAAKAYAFSGIHIISDNIFPILEKYSQENGEVFSITDFYLSICDKCQIRGVVPENFRMVDVGKISSLATAEDFLASDLK